MTALEQPALEYDTSSVPTQDRFSYWSDFISRHIIGVSMSAENPDTFQGCIQLHQLGETSVSFSSADACSARGVIGSSAPGADERSTGWLLVCHKVPGRICQGRSEAYFKANDVLLIDRNRAYCRDLGTVRATSILIPKSVVPDTFTRGLLEDSVAYRLSSTAAGWSRILSANMAALNAEFVSRLAVNEYETRLLLDHIGHTLVLALTEARGQASPTREACASISGAIRRELRGRICAWLKENYPRPNLTAQTVATEFGISVRYVHQLFADAPGRQSFLSTLRGYRFEHAVRLLHSPANRTWPIAEVARQCGFSDPAYFCLAFRQRMGCSPRAFRASLLSRANERFWKDCQA